MRQGGWEAFCNAGMPGMKRGRGRSVFQPKPGEGYLSLMRYDRLLADALLMVHAGFIAYWLYRAMFLMRGLGMAISPGLKGGRRGELRWGGWR